MALRINGGYFVLRQDIFDYLNEGEDLVMDALRAGGGRRTAAGDPVRRVLGADGHAQGAHGAGGPLPHRRSPWAVWRSPSAPGPRVRALEVPDVMLSDMARR